MTINSSSIWIFKSCVLNAFSSVAILISLSHHVWSFHVLNKIVSQNFSFNADNYIDHFVSARMSPHSCLTATRDQERNKTEKQISPSHINRANRYNSDLLPRVRLGQNTECVNDTHNALKFCLVYFDIRWMFSQDYRRPFYIS